MTATCLWKLSLKPTMSRLLWFLVDSGAVGKVLCNGWQRIASEQLGIHRITINRNVHKMVAMGILSAGDLKGEIFVHPGILRPSEMRKKIRTRKIEQVGKK